MNYLCTAKVTKLLTDSQSNNYNKPKTMFRRLFIILTLTVLASVAKAQGDGVHTRLTNLPHVYINTFTGNPITSKTTMVYARMWYVDESDAVAFYDSLEIRVRGNSTAGLAKKPYKLKFHEKVKLLGKGRPNTKKWTLLANHADKTLLRNALTSLMGERAGLPFNPAAKFVDLTVNGQYVGNYQLSDQVDVRPHRVNVVEQDYPLRDTSNITGGYLLEADGFKDFVSGTTGFNTSRNRVPVRVHYPDEDEIDKRQLSYIQQSVQDFETRLFSRTFDDPLTGYRPRVDSVTLANWYICTEICANVDGFFSTYFYKQQDDDRLYWGPLWDYDIAYNNDSRSDRGGTSNTERQLMKDVGYGGSGGGCRDWLAKMWNDPWFARLINRRYREIVDGGMEQYLNEKLDSLTALIDESQQLNYQRWGISTRAYRERVLYSTYDQYVEDVRTFIHRHMDYLTTAFAEMLPDKPQTEPEEPEEKKPDFKADTQSYYAILNAKTGTCFDANVQTGVVSAWSRDTESETQQWLITNLENGYLFITNRATGQALADPSPAGSTATTMTGSQLMLAEADSTDTRQQWDIVSQGSDLYNLVSLWSQHAANLNGGNAANGTQILSYTSDDRNASSTNRLWRIEKAGDVIDTPIDTDINDVATDYALAYDPVTKRLHFGADRREELTFSVAVYDGSGRRVATFRATDDFSLLPYPAGLYIISWKAGQRQQSVKLVKE